MKKLTFLCIFFLTQILIAQNVVSLSSLGIRPNTFQDVTKLVQQAIDQNAQGNTVLKFDAGRYDFWPNEATKKSYYVSNTSKESDLVDKTKTIGLLFKNKQNLTIDANGALFVFHGKMTPWVFDNCENIVFKNLEMDFEIPTMAQFEVTQKTDDFVDIKIHTDSKFEIINQKIQFYGEGWKLDRNFFTIYIDKNHLFKYGNSAFLRQGKAQRTSDNTVRLFGNFKGQDIPQETYTVRDAIRDQVGSLIWYSRNIVFENLSMHYLHGFGMISQFSKDITYKNVGIFPKKENGRMIASFADGFHFSGCSGKITVDQANFDGLHDDAINVHGTYLKIAQILDSKTLLLQFMHPETYGFLAFSKNDSIAILQTSTLEKKDFNLIESVELVNKTQIKVKLKKNISETTTSKDVVENISATPEVLIQNSKFTGTNTRGILVSTPKKVVIQNNHFIKTGMNAIRIPNDANSWYESGAVENVLIQNNIFESCGHNNPSDGFSIDIAPEIHQKTEKVYLNKNIFIKNNTFILDSNAILSASNTNGLFFENNILKTSKNWKSKAISSFRVNDSKNIRILNTKFEDNLIPKIEIDKQSEKHLKTNLKLSKND